MTRARSSLIILSLLAACTPARAPPPDRAESRGPPPAAPSSVASIEAPVEPPKEMIAWPPRAPGIATSWCLEGVTQALADDACVVFPDAPSATLLVYLHGLVPPGTESPEKRNVETVVANASRRAGVVALLPRGMTRDALASGHDEKGLGTYRSWPTGDEGYRAHAKALVDHIAIQRRALETLVGRPFERVYLAGSSAGAYFVGHLALRGDFPADGFAALSGGSDRPAPHLATLPKRPFYIGYGDGDTVGPKCDALAALLRGAGWDVRVRVHHTSHGAREVYLDEAFELFGITKPAPP